MMTPAHIEEVEMRGLVIVSLALLGASPLQAGAPKLYEQVTSVNWVVKDIDRVAAGWAELGFPVVQDFGEVTLPVRYRGEPQSAVVRVARANLAGLDVFWFQPVAGESAWSDFLEARGEGVMSIEYSAPSNEALDAEVARLEGLGVGVLQTMEVDAGAGPVRLVLMDTEEGGKYVVGLTVGTLPAPSKVAPPPPFGAKLSQYALVVEDLQATSDYWERLGFPAMEVTHPALTDLEYHGQPGQFDQKLGWHRHGTVTWEWIEPLAGPTVYKDFLDEHGEGFHHFAFDVPDIDEVAEVWTEDGYPIVQSGGWGEKGQPGSGRFAYADTTPIGDVTIELLWNHRGEGQGD
jgi:catechol 2,3-dioxygenase-like lactoylglutathione lyase family enzyme